MFLFLRQALDIINVISSRSTSRGLLGKPPAKTILAARSGLVWINFKRKYSHKHRHRRILLEHYNFLSFVAETLRNSRQNTQSRNKHTHTQRKLGGKNSVNRPQLLSKTNSPVSPVKICQEKVPDKVRTAFVEILMEKSRVR